MEKNKKILLSIMIILTITIIAISIIMTKKEEIEINENGKHILVQKIHENYAWGYVSYGSFICTDGTIYTYDNSGNKENRLNGSSEQKMIETSKKSNKKVSNRDMKILKENIIKLDKNKIKTRNVGNDIGFNAIEIFTEDGPIIIKQSGDFEGENKTNEAQNIIKIANKYL